MTKVKVNDAFDRLRRLIEEACEPKQVTPTEAIDFLEREVNDAFDRLRRLIEQACEPKQMTPTEAIDFLERIEAHCQSSVEALKEEN